MLDSCAIAPTGTKDPIARAAIPPKIRPGTALVKRIFSTPFAAINFGWRKPRLSKKQGGDPKNRFDAGTGCMGA
jgi:hypothetical protein